MNGIRPISWNSESKVLTLLDQTLLPSREKYNDYMEPAAVADAIRNLVVRGAPAIGCSAAFALVLAAHTYSGKDPDELASRVREASRLLVESRPTAVNLFWAAARMEEVLENCGERDPAVIREVLEEKAVAIFEEDLASCLRIGELGAALVKDGARVMTYCNAGALATAGYGTALGIIRSASKLGKLAGVWVCETRPVLQGARLTAWELMRDEIPFTLIADNSAGSLMHAGEVDCVVVGADRIAANGDVANKIGTYTLAVLARRHGATFTVAAPLSTVDLSLPAGKFIAIEERPPGEVSEVMGVRVAPAGVKVRNSAFDVTPAELVDAIVTEKGIALPDFTSSLKALFAAGS